MNGYGTLNVTLFAMRCAVNFRYYRATDMKTSIATSNSITFNGGIHGSVPHAVRQSYGPDPTTQIWLSFTTNSDRPAPFAIVNGRTYVGTTTTYGAADLCADPANRTAWDWFTDVGYFHHVLIDNLQPGVEVVATFGQQQQPNLGSTTLRPLKRRTAKKNNNNNDNINGVRFVVIGDLGTYPAPASDTTVAALNKLTTTSTSSADDDAIQFVAHIGDIAYANGHGFIYDLFHAIVEPVARRLPWLVSVGNHEIVTNDATCRFRFFTFSV